jgi:hypothetical protein
VNNKMKNSLTLIFKQLTIELETAIKLRDKGNLQKTKYRKVAAHIEQSLKSLESAINLIGE